jgi:hypothetical protein
MGKLIGVVVLGLALFFGAIFLAGDLGGEVVVLMTTAGDDGGRRETKLWIVEDNGQLWLRAGQPDSEWLERLRARPHVTLVRNGAPRDYRAVAIPKQRERINRLMAERYGWADSLIGLVRDESETVPIRLDPVR